MKNIETKHYKVTIDDLEEGVAFDGVIGEGKTHYTLNQNYYNTKEAQAIGITRMILCDEMCSVESGTEFEQIDVRSNEIAEELIEILSQL